MIKKTKTARVSDHAVVRYLERAKGFNFDQVRNKIQRAAQAVLNTGASNINLEGVELVITEEGVVITAMERKPSHLRRSKPSTVVTVD